MINSKDMSDESNNQSLLAQAKGIEPLIIAVFILIIYWLASAIMFFISYRFGRI